MKKIFAILLSMIMVMGLFAACGNNTPTEANGNAPQITTDPQVTDPTPTEPAFTTVNPGKLTMATNAFFAPYEYYEGDKIVGIDAEIAEAIAEKLGLELQIDNMEFDTIITAVATGAADFGLAGMTITPTRLEEVDFSISYANGKQVVIVKEGSSITSVDDLGAEGATYKIGVQLGTTGDTYASKDYEGRVTQYSNGNQAVLALQSGDVDCVIIDNEPAKALVAANEGLTILETAYADEDYAACFAKGNNALLEAVNTAIEELTMDGTIDAIIAKYIPAN